MISKTDQSGARATGGWRFALFSRKKRQNTVIAADMKIVGELESDGHVHIDGTVEGDIYANFVTVGETAHVEGVIIAEEVQIAGSVEGRIEAPVVFIEATARVVGSIFHTEIEIEKGALIEGRRPWRPKVYLAERSANRGVEPDAGDA